MKAPYRIFLTLIVAISLISSSSIIGQDLTVDIGHKEIIKSKILNEEREILINLPKNYDHSNNSYPVLYRLDRSEDLLIETISVVNRLTYSDEITPEMIIVAIKNIKRDKDMWPVNTLYYPQPKVPGAESFMRFIGEELLPFMDNTYRTTNERMICGQSLSSLFVLYTFLKQPGLFDSYIASSGAFPDCEEYFKKLTDESILQKNKFGGQKLFITNGMKDPLDPRGVIHQQMLDFSDKINNRLGPQNVSLKYQVYENEGHVPFHSLHDALRFFYNN